VDIKFPDRSDDPEAVAEESSDVPRASDIIRVTGRPENCESAKQALLEQVPVVVEVDIPFDMHRYIIGKAGKDVRELMRAYDVNIAVPPQERQSNTIVISGSPKSAAAAKEALLEKRHELEAKSFEVKLQVDAEYHPKIIGQRGAMIKKMREKYDVNIQLPKRDEGEDIITIVGVEDQVLAARDEIMKIVTDLSGRVAEDVEIDHRVHSRIIGSRGKNVREIMKKFDVEIRFPKSGDKNANPNLVTISGSDRDRVLDAKDELLNLEEEYIQDVTEHEYMKSFVKGPSGGKEGDRNKDKPANGFVVKGAPWEQGKSEAPDTQNTEEFPSFGNGVAAANADSGIGRPLSSVWGPRKHF